MENTTLVKGKKNGYSRAKINQKIARKRNEAIKREVIYESLSKEQKIKLIKSRRGNSKKELARIENFNSNL